MLNTQQTAEFLGIHPSWLEHARIEGRGPRFVKFGRHVRYRREGLLSFVEENVVSTSNFY